MDYAPFLPFFTHTHIPLLHFTVGLARVIDEATDVAHAIAVDHNSAVNVYTVMVPFASVFFHHSMPELFLAHHLATVLYDERAYATATNSSSSAAEAVRHLFLKNSILQCM